jgi:hypothetical protein
MLAGSLRWLIAARYSAPPASFQSRADAGGGVLTTKLRRIVSLFVRIQRPDQEQIHAVIHRGQLGLFP